MNDSLKKIYEKHHTINRKEGFGVLLGERGSMLKDAIGSGKDVLDIGCRDGALTKYFSQGNRVLGVDIDENALKKAKSELGIETQAMDLNGDWQELAGKKFDAVFAGEVLEHLYYPEEAVGKIASRLKEEGIFLGTVPNAFSLKNRLRYLFGRKKNTPLEDPTHINHFGCKELENLLKKHFKNVSISGIGRFGILSKIMPKWFAFSLFFRAE